MPKYEAECGVCGEIKTYIRSVAERENTPECHGKPMKKGIFSAPKGYVLGRFDSFRSTVDGTIISTRRGLEEHNKRNGVVSLADGYSDEKIRRGEFRKKERKLDKRKLKHDIAEATMMVKNGYKPKVLKDER